MADISTEEAGTESDLAILQQAWINEVFAPDVLTYETETVGAVLQQIEAASDQLDTLQELGLTIAARIVDAELARAKFISSAYLRVRLLKISRFAMFFEQNEDQQAKLSSSELAFLRDYLALQDEHLRASFVRSLPESAQRLREEAMIEMPDMSKHVMCKVSREVRGYEIIPGGDAFTLEVGDIWAFPYSRCRPLLRDEYASLC